MTHIDLSSMDLARAKLRGADLRGAILSETSLYGADLSGANVATPLLFKIFNTIDYDSDEEWFSPPADCEQRKVCSETGLLPTDHCSNIVMDYFIPMISTTKTCDNWREILVSADDKISYCKSCVPESGAKWSRASPERRGSYTRSIARPENFFGPGQP